jgi:hypothetical protein
MTVSFTEELEAAKQALMRLSGQVHRGPQRGLACQHGVGSRRPARWKAEPTGLLARVGGSLITRSLGKKRKNG